MEARASASSVRKRATNSCTECRKRRKKCNEARPSCSNCSRRWPAVECIYKDKSPTTYDDHGSSEPQPQRQRQQRQQQHPPPGQSSLITLPILTAHSHNEQTRSLTIPSLSLSVSSRSNSTDISEEWHRAEADGRITYGLPMEGSEAHAKWMDWARERDLKLWMDGLDDAVEEIDGEVHVWGPRFWRAGSLPRSLLYSTYDLLASKGVPPTRNNAELFNIYNAMAPSIYSIDGTTPTANLFTEVWQHHGSQSPLMIRSHLFSAAGLRLSQSSIATCNSTLIVTDPVQGTSESDAHLRSIVSLRLEIISMLNQRLSRKSPDTQDDTIAVLLPFIYEEWMYHQNPFEDSPHVNGLLSMIKMRGGMHKLGMRGLLAKMIIHLAYNLATASDAEPFLSYDERTHASLSPPPSPIAARLTSPLFPVTFSSSENCAIWGVSLDTVSVIDEMSFLISNIHMPDGSPYTPIQSRNRIFSFPSIRSDIEYEICRLASRLYCDLLFPHTPNSRPIPPISPLSQQSSRPGGSRSPDTSGLTNYRRYPRTTINSTPDLEQLLECVKLGSLSKWARMPAVWLWILLLLASCTAGRAEGALMRLWQHTCGSALMLDDWRVLVGSFESFLGLQRWRRGTSGSIDKAWGVL